MLVFGCSPESDAPIKPDIGWATTELENGLVVSQYQKTGEPLSFRLVVHAGSLQETAKQSGYAHFLEHLFFRVENVPEQNAVKETLFQSGVSFGADLNAFTYNQYTAYELSIDDAESLNAALSWLAYVAGGMTVTEAMIEQEKGVVIGEMRVTRPDPQPYADKAYQHLLKGTELESHDILGSKSSIENMDIKELQGFYQQWYQPQNMELWIVGDWGQNDLLTTINRHFGSIKKGEQPRRTLIDPIEFNDEPFVAKALPQEYATLDLGYQMPNPVVITEADQLVQLGTYFISDLVSNRLSELNRSPEFTLQGLNTYPMDLHGHRWLLIGAAFEESERDKVQQAVTAAVASLTQHGISEDELDTVKRSWVSFNDQLLNDIQVWTSKELIDYKFGMMQAQSIAQDPNQYVSVHRRLVDKMTVRHANKAIKKLFSQSPIIAVNTKHESVDVSAITAGLKQKTDKPLQMVVSKTLAVPDTKGSVVSIEKQEHDLVLWKLSNDIEVLYAQHDKAADKFYGWFGSLGGSAILDKALMASGQLFPLVALNSHIGPLTPEQIERSFRRSNSYVEPFIRDAKHGMVFGTNEKGIADVMSVMHHAMSLTDVDGLAVDKAKTMLINELKRLEQEPEFKTFNDAFRLGLDTYSHLQSRTESEVAMVNKESVLEAYNKLVRVNRGYKMVLVGSKPAAEVKSIIEQYIASIEFTDKAAYSWPTASLKSSGPASMITIDNYPSQDGKSKVYMVSVAERNEPRTAKDVFAEDMLQRLLNERVMQTLRVDNSLDYSPEAYGFLQEGNGLVGWSFYAHVEPKDETKTMSLFKDVTKDVLNGFEAQERDKVVAQLKSDLSPWSDNPENMSFMLFRYWLFGYGTEALYNYESVAESVTLSDLDRMAKQEFGRNSNKFSLLINP
ncbi:insulinase family protein [Vibrio sp. 10N]|nr:insulinase family protein [Vibrio sp. 10N]